MSSLVDLSTFEENISLNFSFYLAFLRENLIYPEEGWFIIRYSERNIRGKDKQTSLRQKLKSFHCHKKVCKDYEVVKGTLEAFLPIHIVNIYIRY